MADQNTGGEANTTLSALGLVALAGLDADLEDGVRPGGVLGGAPLRPRGRNTDQPSRSPKRRRLRTRMLPQTWLKETDCTLAAFKLSGVVPAVLLGSPTLPSGQGGGARGLAPVSPLARMLLPYSISSIIAPDRRPRGRTPFVAQSILDRRFTSLVRHHPHGDLGNSAGPSQTPT